MEGYPFLAGQLVRGRIVDLKDRRQVNNESVPHAVMPFKGTRYSVVYSWKERPRERLRELDFRPRGCKLRLGVRTADFFGGSFP